MKRLSSLLHLTEGQTYTVFTASFVAVVLLALGLPSLRTTPVDAASSRTRTKAPLGEIVPDPVPLGSAFSGAIVPTPTTEPELSLEVPTAPLPARPGERASTTRSSSEPPSDKEDSGSGGDGGDLAVTFGRYASASGPLVPGGAPGALFPVGLRLGAADKQSYVRLNRNGEGGVLRLAVSGTAGHSVGTAQVKACVIVSPGWDFADGAAMSAAPPFDQRRCIDGKAGETEWTFEVGDMSAPDGFALVPVGDATTTFQIVFLGVES